MPRRDIVCVGASAGGVEALTALCRQLPADLAAALLIVLHVGPGQRSVLPRILSAAGPLPARHAVDGDPIANGHILIAPPDHHMLVHGNSVRVMQGPRENNHRPAIDALFRTAASAQGPRVIGVVLTGYLDDGAAGLVAVKRQGGLAMVQDPEEAFCGDMPRAALAVTDVDGVLRIAELARVLPDLVLEEVDERSGHDRELIALESDILLTGGGAQKPPPGIPSTLSCPGCGGVLNEVYDGRMLRFRCQVGHAYAPDTLARAQKDALEQALWAALRALEDQASLGRRMAQRARELGRVKSAARYDERAVEVEHQAHLVREALSLPPHQPRHDVAPEAGS